MHGLEKLICTPSHDKVGVLKVSSKLGKYFLSYASDKKRTEIRKITRCYLRVERKQIKVIRVELRDMNALL